MCLEFIHPSLLTYAEEISGFTIRFFKTGSVEMTTYFSFPKIQEPI